jgi:hypothetical protein
MYEIQACQPGSIWDLYGVNWVSWAFVEEEGGRSRWLEGAGRKGGITRRILCLCSLPSVFVLCGG